MLEKLLSTKEVQVKRIQKFITDYPWSHKSSKSNLWLSLISHSADELFVPLVFLTSLILAFLRKVGVTLAERGPRHRGHAVNELGLEKDVGIGEHAVFEGHDHELEG